MVGLQLTGRFIDIFLGNLVNILRSIRIAKEQGAKLRVGPELEIT